MKNSSIYLFFGLLTAVVAGASLRPIEPANLSATPLQLDGKFAYEKMTELANVFPHRWPGHTDKTMAAEWVKREFVKMGYDPHEQLFSERIKKTHYRDFANIWAEKRGSIEPDQLTVVLAHYDSAETSASGAMDDASGVGIVLELAKVFQHERPSRSMIFLITDSEELGAFWGARAFAREFDRRDRITAALSLDFVGPGDQAGILSLHDGLARGFTPLWLRQIAVDSIRSATSLRVEDPTNLLEYVQRALLFPPADHGAFLETGIPSFNWVGISDPFTEVMAHVHHTERDVAAEMRPQSFTDYGRAVERVMRTLDEYRSPERDKSSSNYLKISSHWYIPGWAVTLLQVLLFAPVFAVAARRARALLGAQADRSNRVVALDEGKRLAALAGGLVAGACVLRTLPTLNVLPYYELYPGTAKSDVTMHLNVAAIAITVGTAILVKLVLSKVLPAEKHEFDHPNPFEVRKTLMVAWVGIVSAVMLFWNPYGATLFMLAPLVAWTSVTFGPAAKTTQWLKMALGTVPFVLVFIVTGITYQYPYVFYYLFLSAAYGLFPLIIVFAFLIVLTVMIRLVTLVRRSAVAGAMRSGAP